MSTALTGTMSGCRTICLRSTSSSPGSADPSPATAPPPAPRAAFTHEGPADVMPPGPDLAFLACEVQQAGAEHLDDDQLTGLLQAAHRLVRGRPR